MRLEELEFKDLLLFADGTAFMKGSPGSGSHLMPLPSEYKAEAAQLLETLAQQSQTVMRLSYDNLCFRVARIDDADGRRVWFLRRLASSIPKFSRLDINPTVTGWLLRQRQGLVLFAGAQGSGKTTTASAYVAEKLEINGGHAVTYEIPVELPLGGPHGEYGQCFQQEIFRESDLAQQIELAHRYASPDIIFIGEIRTKYAALEALRIALGSNRQLVVATIHGLDVPTALERLIGWARELDGDNASQNLADALLAILYLTLESTDSGTSVTAPQYLLIPFKEESKGLRAIIREGKFNNLADDMRSLKNRITNKKERWDE